MIDINLADFIIGEGQKDNNKVGHKLKFSIDKCPDKDAFIKMSISGSLINQSGSDTMSMMSGFDNMSMDSGPDPDFQFNDISSKMSLHKKPEKKEKIPITKESEEAKQDDIE